MNDILNYHVKDIEPVGLSGSLVAKRPGQLEQADRLHDASPDNLSYFKFKYLFYLCK